MAGLRGLTERCCPSQGRSRTPGSSWTPSQGRSRPRSRQRPGTVCARQVPCSTSAVPVSQPRCPLGRPAPGARRWAVTACSSPEYVITMYDTKSRELRWNATFSDYSAPLCEDSYHYSEWPPRARGPRDEPQSPARRGDPGAMLPWPAHLGCAHCWGERLRLSWEQSSGHQPAAGGRAEGDEAPQPAPLHRPFPPAPPRNGTLRLERGRAGGDAGQGERRGPVGAELRLARGWHLRVAPGQPPPHPPPQPGHGDPALRDLPLAGHPPPPVAAPLRQGLRRRQDPAAVRGPCAALASPLPLLGRPDP